MSIREALQGAYLWACELELQAFKPGNVSVHSEGHEMTVEDFRLSARSSALFLCDPALSLGESIYLSIDATRKAVGCNTNLGIVLLAAPLLRACQSPKKHCSLKGNLSEVLQGTTRQDADWVFRAIRLAAPGGLGTSDRQDVNETPHVTLLEAMRIAEERDRIAFQYSNRYSNVFDFGIPRYHSGLSRWGDEVWATVALFAGLLKHFPDSHIERKFGTRFTHWVSERMAQVDEALSGSEEPERIMPLLREVDAEFKSRGINPGTTADLTVACLLAARLEALYRFDGK